MKVENIRNKDNAAMSSCFYVREIRTGSES